MKVATTQGIILDWMAAKAGGYEIMYGDGGFRALVSGIKCVFRPSIDPATCYLLLNGDGISLTQFKDDEVDVENVGMWCAAYDREDFGKDDRSSIGMVMS